MTHRLERRIRPEIIENVTELERQLAVFLREKMDDKYHENDDAINDQALIWFVRKMKNYAFETAFANILTPLSVQERLSAPNPSEKQVVEEFKTNWERYFIETLPQFNSDRFPQPKQQPTLGRRLVRHLRDRIFPFLGKTDLD